MMASNVDMEGRMAGTQHLWLFIVSGLLLNITPGPDSLFIMARSASQGWRAGLVACWGVGAGVFVHVFAAALGLSALLATSAMAFTVVKIVGAAYLVWLGIQAIRHRHDHRADVAREPTPAWRLLRQGFIVGATNPKTIAFFVAVLPQFVSPAAGPVWAQLLLLGLVFQTIALVCDSIWVLAAGTARTWFARSPRRMSTLSGTGGVMMIGLGGTLALTGAKS